MLRKNLPQTQMWDLGVAWPGGSGSVFDTISSDDSRGQRSEHLPRWCPTWLLSSPDVGLSTERGVRGAQGGGQGALMTSPWQAHSIPLLYPIQQES